MFFDQNKCARRYDLYTIKINEVKMEISATTIDNLIGSSWDNVRDRVEGGNPCSSEKTLVFLFAMELVRSCNNSLIIDFENQCYANLEGESKYLDLLFYTNENYKVAIEFKMPRSSTNGGSDKLKMRRGIYKDIERLKHLKDSNFAQARYFLMATDENFYLHNKDIRMDPEIKTKHEHSEQFGDITVFFRWNNFNNVIFRGNGDFQLNDDGKYFWLEKIKI